MAIATEQLSTMAGSGNHVTDSDAATPKHALRTLGVWVDGAPMATTGQQLRSTLKGVSALAASRKWAMIGSAHAEEVEIHAPGMHLTVGSQGARAYESESERVRWAHLEMDVNGALPSGATGLVAEFAGLQKLSQRTKSYLAVPKAVYRKRHRPSKGKTEERAAESALLAA